MDGQSNVITILAAQANQSSLSFSFIGHEHGNQNNFTQNQNNFQQNRTNKNPFRRFTRSRYCIISICETQEHVVQNCSALGKLSIQQMLLAQKNICENCLKIHKSEVCTSNYLCRVCNARHHSHLHTEKISASQVSTAKNDGTHYDPNDEISK